MLWRRGKAFNASKLPWATFSAALRPALEAQIEDAVAGAIASALARGLQVHPEVIAQAVAEMAPEYTDALLAELMETTSNRTSAAVARYTAGEISIDEMFASVDTLFNPARADSIATTETTRMFEVLNQVINADAGVEKVTFLSVRDFAVCPECQALDNQVFDIADMDDDNTPPIHPSCRCFTAATVPEAVSQEPVTVAA